MKRFFSLFFVLFVASAVLLPGLASFAATCDCIEAAAHQAEHGGLHFDADPNQGEPNPSSAPSSRCDHAAHHCGGSLHHGGCGHVATALQSAPVLDLSSPSRVVFGDFVARATPPPDLDGPLQPPRA